MERIFDNPEVDKVYDEPMRKGAQKIWEFDNGYGASVVRWKSSYLAFDNMPNYFSYTDNENEWELGVLYHGSLTYDTPITNDVLGHLTEDEVEEILKQIKALPEEKK